MKKPKKKLMRMTDLAREICAREGGKRQVNIAQVSEILHCLTNLIRENPLTVVRVLVQRASRRP